ncbi:MULTISPECIES: alpha/beta hydrolase [unclassified Serratia (in: enterobacteria)]|uniref:alpha/beta hydrolase n=1 Tax=unclassified Serratia (in: enterobacteria) TaxID=2647522 RepID=UPI0004FFFC2F|nr:MULTISPECIES: alpha/beta hydrolase [unclassified Serratia (in: enterobacteria)]KFK92878.1 esterase [Serratia sp. Ag2]KFK94170.1 esterase [Serratia sp. Ag1]
MQSLYRNMNRLQLDAAYNNTKAVQDFPALLAQFQQRSAAWYAAANVQRDIPYANAARARFDFFPSQTSNAATLIFIHGGYWQNCTKEDFAFIAEGPCNSNINVILAEYTLAPEASMTTIVNEIGALLDFLAHHQPRFNITPGKVCLSGHSAGGHLTAVHRGHPLVSHAMPISALVDLEPISLSWLNDNLALTPKEIRDYSPIHSVSVGVPVAVQVGAEELPELIRHSQEYAEALAQCGNPVMYQRVAGCNHFSLLNEFQPGGKLLQALRDLLVQ